MANSVNTNLTSSGWITVNSKHNHTKNENHSVKPNSTSVSTPKNHVNLSENKNPAPNKISYDILPFRHIVSTTNKVLPINSYGLIPYNIVQDKWLLVQRRYSPAFFIVLQGNYRDVDLNILLNELTNTELSAIKIMITNPKTIPGVLQRFLTNVTDKSIEYTTLRFASANFHKLITMVTGRSEGEWLFPSGRPSAQDKSGYDTAIREFHEESGIDSRIFNIKNLLHDEIVEKIETSIIRNHRHYYPYVMYETITPKVLSLDNDDIEITQARWVTETEAVTLLSATRFQYLLSAKIHILEYVKNSSKGTPSGAKK